MKHFDATVSHTGYKTAFVQLVSTTVSICLKETSSRIVLNSIFKIDMKMGEKNLLEASFGHIHTVILMNESNI